MKFQSIPVRLTQNQDYPSKTKTDGNGHPHYNADGTEKMTTHFRIVEFSDISDQSFLPDTLRFRLFADQADRFNFPVGTQGYLLVDIVNRTIAKTVTEGEEKKNQEIIDVKIKDFSVIE